MKTVNILATIVDKGNILVDSKAESSTPDGFKSISIYAHFCPFNKHLLSSNMYQQLFSFWNIAVNKTPLKELYCWLEI